MNLSICTFCGGHIPLGPDASNLCDGCGRSLYYMEAFPPVAGIDDSELVALRQEVASLRKENETLKKIERQRWENVNKTLGTAYSTEQANEWMNLPMNINDFGTRRPGDF